MGAVEYAQPPADEPEVTQPVVGFGSGELFGFTVGDMVDCKKWDATVPPVNRLGISKVVRVWSDKCQSGIMVKVRGKGTQELDSHWLTLFQTNIEHTSA